MSVCLIDQTIGVNFNVHVPC